MKLIPIATRALVAAMYVVSALVMHDHPALAGVFFTIPSCLLAVLWWISRRGEALAEAVGRSDVDAIERIAQRSIAYRYQALVLVGLLGSVERARSHGRVFCVCGECKEDELDRELDLALRSIELIDRGDPMKAMLLLRENMRAATSVALGMRASLSIYAALLTGNIGPAALGKIEPAVRKAAAMRWPLELAVARALVSHGDVEGGRRRLANAPIAWRKRFDQVIRA